jgi:2-polyprenyl-3-methyl-5-hydroxy-6-metoxy-1,4-benzoquinol methylase
MAIKDWLKKIRDFFWLIIDPKRIDEHYGHRVVTKRLTDCGFLDSNLQCRRVLEIGPKHGLDTMDLSLRGPDEVVVIDLPCQEKTIREWSVGLPSSPVVIIADVSKMTEEDLIGLGVFDVILCAGVLYHLDEQLRFLKMLHTLSAPGCKIIIESATTRRYIGHSVENEPIVEVRMPGSYRGVKTITHLPSRETIKLWMLMAGFTDVTIHDKLYSKHLRHDRTVVTAIKGA